MKEATFDDGRMSEDGRVGERRKSVGRRSSRVTVVGRKEIKKRRREDKVVRLEEERT